MQCKGFMASEECPDICCHECDRYSHCRDKWRCESLVLYEYCKENCRRSESAVTAKGKGRPKGNHLRRVV